jgi:hypothetical protein
LQPITAPFEPPNIQSDCKTVPKRNKKKYFLLLYLLPAMTAPRSVSHHHLLSRATHLRLTPLSFLYSAFSFPNFSALHLSTYNHSHTHFHSLQLSTFPILFPFFMHFNSFFMKFRCHNNRNTDSNPSVRLLYSRSSSFGPVTRLRVGLSGVRIPVEATDYSRLENVMIDYGANPASYGDSFRAVERLENKADHSPPSAETQN